MTAPDAALREVADQRLIGQCPGCWAFHRVPTTVDYECECGERIEIVDLRAALNAAPAPAPERGAEVMRRMSSDNPRSRHHREDHPNGWSSWSCIPIRDAVEARAALLAAPPAPEGGLDPLTGETLRGAIAAATDLINPRLSEVEWDDVAAALSYMTGAPEGGVDVTRWWRAMEIVAAREGWSFEVDGTAWNVALDTIAAEYARLTRTPEPE